MLLGCLTGDEEAARRLHAQLAPVMLAYALALLRDQDRAADAVQETLCRLLQLTRDRVRDMQDARAYVLGMLRNEVRALLRRKRSDDSSRLARPGAPAPASLPHHADDTASLAAAIQSLPEALREVLLLKHVAGLTFEQMALTTGENRNTLASRHRQAVQQLRALLAHPNATEELSHA